MHTQLLTETLAGLALMIPYGLIGLLAFFASDWLMRLHEPSGWGRSSGKSLTALGVRRLGLFIALGIGLSGVYANGEPNFANDLKDSAFYAVLLVLMMWAALWLNDLIVLPGVPNSFTVGHSNNTAVATVEAASMIATGFLAKSAIAGDDGGVLATIVFFALGQIALSLSVRLYAALLGKPGIVIEVEDGNLAAGLVLGATIVAYGLVVSTALGGTFTGWADGIMSFGLTALVGIIFLLAASWLVDYVIIRWCTVRNIIERADTGSAFVYMGGLIGMAYVVSTLLL